MLNQDGFFTVWWLEQRKGLVNLCRRSFLTLAAKKEFQKKVKQSEGPCLFLSSKSELAVAFDPTKIKGTTEEITYRLACPGFEELL